MFINIKTYMTIKIPRNVLKIGELFLNVLPIYFIFLSIEKILILDKIALLN